MNTPSPTEVRQSLALLDARQHKLVGGVLAVMIKNPDRVRDREWITEQLTHLYLLASDAEGDGPDGVVEAQRYLEANVNPILNASYQLFLRVAEDLAPRAQAGFTFEKAMEQAMAYF